jgi:phosphatidylinositol glycan class M
MLVISTLALAMRRNYDAAAMMLGLSVHFKIYPFIYGASLLASMNSKVGVERESTQQHSPFLRRIKALVTIERVRFALISALSFGIFNIAMYSM